MRRRAARARRTWPSCSQAGPTQTRRSSASALRAATGLGRAARAAGRMPPAPCRAAGSPGGPAAPARRPQLHAAGHRHGRDGDAVVGGARRGATRSGSSRAARRARVRGVEVHSAGPRARRAPASESRSTWPASSARDVQRGDVVVAGDAAPAAGYLLDVEVRLLPGARPLSAGARVHVHHGTRETPARVAPARGRDCSSPGSRASRSCGSSSRSLAAAGDRFVMRQHRAAGHDRRRTRARPAAAQARAGARRTSTRLRALAFGRPAGAAAARDRGGPLGPRGRADRAAELERLAGAGEAVAVGGAPATLVHARRCSRSARGDCWRRWRRRGPAPAQPRRRSRTPPGSTRAARRRSWRRWRPRARCDRRGGGYVRGRGTRPPDPLARRLLALLEADGLQPALARRRWPQRAGVEPAEAREALDRLAARRRGHAGEAGPLLPPRWRWSSARDEVVSPLRARRGRDDRGPARPAGHQPQVRPGAAGAPRRGPRDPAAWATSTSCGRK